MYTFMIGALISLVLIVVCSAMFYELLAHLWLLVAKLMGRPRTQIIVTIVANFVAHTIAVWLFGVAYFLLDAVFGMGALKGAAADGSFFEYTYFSGVTYSSLGMGDMYPTGPVQQLLIGVESVLGLVLIGWTVTFTYMVTHQYMIHRSGRDHPLLSWRTRIMDRD